LLVLERSQLGHSTHMLTILFDGIAYGMLLFVLACGLAVTLGLMNFVNLAHGAFAMAGGYCLVVLVNRLGFPFFAALPLAFLFSAIFLFLLSFIFPYYQYTLHPHFISILTLSFFISYFFFLFTILIYVPFISLLLSFSPS
jgi:branched-chain amino acid transport system permease protein